MSTMSYTVSGAREDTVATPSGVLIPPSEVMAVLRTLNLECESVLETLPEPLPVSGLVVSLPGMPVHTLPPGWAGVWARPEAPPAGAWVPLPGAAISDPQALRQALQAADAWRRERLQFSQQAVEKAEALKTVNEIGIALSAERDPDRPLELVLTRARQLVAADAGSLYLVKKDEPEHHHLYFALAQNDSVEAPWKASVMP